MTSATPDPELAAALAAMPAHYPVANVDRVWAFAPRTAGARASGLAVLSLFAPEPGRRRVVTLRWQRQAGPKARPRDDSWEEHGSCPAERLPRVVEGVVRRAGADGQPAEAFDVAGSDVAWSALLAALARPA